MRILVAVLAGALWPFGAQAALVSNGGFEAGLAGWTVTGDGISSDSVFVNSGRLDAAFSAGSADPNAGTLSQTIATTPGRSYGLDFALLDEAGLSGDSFVVRFGGFSVSIAGDTAGPPGALPTLFTPESFDIPGSDVSGSSTVLSFQGLNGPGGIAFNLDDVGLDALAVPEPPSAALLVPLLLGGAMAWVGTRVRGRRRR